MNLVAVLYTEKTVIWDVSLCVVLTTFSVKLLVIKNKKANVKLETF